MQDEYIKKFYNEICESMEGEYKIILEPNRSLTEDWIEYDKVKWTMDESIEILVNSLKKDDTLTFEEKILKVYEHICLNYIYDANVLFFFRKDTSDPNNVKHIACDWYGRIVGEDWIKNRRTHNRRICYEFSRFYAKAINELLDGNDKLEACMVGDKENLHYVVGLTGEDYSAILDQDDFNSIKDLTRAKLGLSIKGVKILRDESGKLQKAVDKYNENKPTELAEFVNTKASYKKQEISMIQYFEKVLEILKSYDIDSQGIFEYMRYIVEEEGFDVEKIWREVNAIPEKRYARCFFFDFNEKTYLLDSVEKTFTITDKDELEKDYVFNAVEKEYPYYGG